MKTLAIPRIPYISDKKGYTSAHCTSLRDIKVGEPQCDQHLIEFGKRIGRLFLETIKVGGGI